MTSSVHTVSLYLESMRTHFLGLPLLHKQSPVTYPREPNDTFTESAPFCSQLQAARGHTKNDGGIRVHLHEKRR